MFIVIIIIIIIIIIYCYYYYYYYYCYMIITRSSQSIKISINLLILNKSVKIGKSNLIDIYCINQSVEIDDTLVLIIDLSWFLPISLIYIGRYIMFICSSKNENWIHANSKFIDNWVAIESWRIKELSLKKIFKKSYLFFKTMFKICIWWLIQARFVGA